MDYFRMVGELFGLERGKAISMEPAAIVGPAAHFGGSDDIHGGKN